MYGMAETMSKGKTENNWLPVPDSMNSTEINILVSLFCSSVHKNVEDTKGIRNVPIHSKYGDREYSSDHIS